MSSVVDIMLYFQERICDVYFAGSLNYDLIIDRGKLREIEIATAVVRNLRFGA
jgi:hypothetical protein